MDETADEIVAETSPVAAVFAPEYPVVWAGTQGAADAVCGELLGAGWVAVDVETTLREPRVLCTIQLGVPGRSYVIDALALRSFEGVRALMESKSVEKVIHSASFERRMFSRHQVRIHNIFDTLLASRKKHGAKRHDSGHKLGQVCARELGIALDKGQQTSDWTRRPLSAAQLAYAAADVEVLCRLYAVLKPASAE